MLPDAGNFVYWLRCGAKNLLDRQYLLAPKGGELQVELRLAAAAELLSAALADVLLSAAKIAHLVGAAAGAVAAALFGTRTDRAVTHLILAILALHGKSLFLSLANMPV